jgi:hypothetical protein
MVSAYAETCRLNKWLSYTSKSFKWILRIKFLYSFPMSTMRTTCPAHLLLLVLIAPTSVDKENKSLSTSLCSFVHPCQFLGSLFWNTAWSTSSFLTPNWVVAVVAAFVRGGGGGGGGGVSCSPFRNATQDRACHAVPKPHFLEKLPEFLCQIFRKLSLFANTKWTWQRVQLTSRVVAT